jgi:tripartite-type tricarboxylate transporter receptor subunit TctC
MLERHFVSALACAVCSAAFAVPRPVAAQGSAADYPSRSIRFVVPFAPGGSTDTLARTIGQKMSDTWGRQVVVDNRSGGNGVIGMEIVARAVPDGQTLVLGYIANLGTAPALIPKLPYDPIRDFAPIAHVTTAPSIAVLHNGVPAKNVQELLAIERARPGTVSFGSATVGSMGHLAGEMLNRLAGVRMQHIAYKGGGQAVIDVLSGQVQMVIIGMAGAAPHVRAGRLRAIATTGLKRSPAFADVPTVAEQGFPGFSAEAWYGVLTTAGTPRPVVDKLSKEVLRILKLPDVQERFTNIGFEIIGSTPEGFAKLIREEIPKWKQVVREGNIRGE